MRRPHFQTGHRSKGASRDWLLARQRQAFIGLDQQMIVWRGEINDPGFDRLLVLSLAHANFAARTNFTVS
jgi:hypothetical protein